jgi:phenylalanyl-tRNA synthetase beta chain
MNIQILDSWLREYLKTDATPEKIGECLSLCGPSIEKIEKIDGDYIYDIEITTNRVDCMSIVGIAREAAAILPQFGIKASFHEPEIKLPEFPTKSEKLVIKSSPTHTKRVMGIVLDNIQNWETPDWMKRRLEASGIRSLNAVVDITNYVMTEIGHPTHVFDYDLLTTKTLVFRESKKGEKITTLDGVKHTLPGGDIVIDDGEGTIVDLPGIMGTQNSVVNDSTKRILFFIDNNDPVKIRRTSMTLAIRTVAATLNEKGVDPELGKLALLRGIELYRSVCKADVKSKIYDVYPEKYTEKIVKITKDQISKRLGVDIKSETITKVLSELGFGVTWKKDVLTLSVPSFRAQDIEIPEDIAEEVARIYGYHNLPSVLMDGVLPQPLIDAPFKFENKVRNILKSMGGNEIYTLALVTAEMVDPKIALQLKNPIGSDTEYLRTSLVPSITNATKENSGVKTPYFLYEIANVYIPQKGELPTETMRLGCIFVNYDYRLAKGIVEQLLDTLQIEYTFELMPAEKDQDKDSSVLSIVANKSTLGHISLLSTGELVFECDMSTLKSVAKDYVAFQETPKFPSQIEDYSFELPNNVHIGELIKTIKLSTNIVRIVELIDIYESTYTVRVHYQDSTRTLTDSDVKKEREHILSIVKKAYQITPKS